jgi:GH25 family lysozyme M1 (1,4-beta-N-acetylmuramidase)
MAIKGILDISRWQTVDYLNRPIPIDWGKLRTTTFDFKGNPVQIVGVIIKCTEGEYGWKHDKYLDTIKAADSFGFWTGSYHWFWAQYNWKRQADFFKANVWQNPNPKKIILEDGSELPHNWLDVEEVADLKVILPGRRAKIVDDANLWCAQVGDCGQYTGDWYWRNLEKAGGKYPLWVADYTNSPAPALPAGWSKWAIWQFYSQWETDALQVEGIKIHIDVNVINAKDDVVVPPPPLGLSLQEQINILGERLKIVEDKLNL